MTIWFIDQILTERRRTSFLTYHGILVEVRIAIFCTALSFSEYILSMLPKLGRHTSVSNLYTFL